MPNILRRTPVGVCVYVCVCVCVCECVCVCVCVCVKMQHEQDKETGTQYTLCKRVKKPYQGLQNAPFRELGFGVRRHAEHHHFLLRLFEVV